MDHNDTTGSTFNLNEGHLDGRSFKSAAGDAQLRATSFGDEQHTLPADFTGHADGDGVSISDDNVTGTAYGMQ